MSITPDSIGKKNCFDTRVGNMIRFFSLTSRFCAALGEVRSVTYAGSEPRTAHQTTTTSSSLLNNALSPDGSLR